MEKIESVLTIKKIAEVLRCSKTHVANLLGGRVSSAPRLCTSILVAAKWCEEFVSIAGLEVTRFLHKSTMVSPRIP